MTDRGGVRVSVPALESDRIARQDEALRIVSEETWGRVQAHLARAAVRWSGVRATKGRLAGRPEGATTSAHLLSGLLKCGGCGAALVPTARSRNAKVRRYYVCSSRYKQGKTACAAKHMLRYDAITDAVLPHFEHLHDGFIDELIAKEWDTWVTERAAAESSLATYREEVARLDSELVNLTDAVAQGGQSIPTLLRALEAKQRARDDASARLEHAQGQLAFPRKDDGTPDPGWHSRMTTLALGVFGTMRETIERRGPDARALLRSIILDPITVTHAYDEAKRPTPWVAAATCSSSRRRSRMRRPVPAPLRPRGWRPRPADPRRRGRCRRSARDRAAARSGSSPGSPGSGGCAGRRGPRGRRARSGRGCAARGPRPPARAASRPGRSTTGTRDREDDVVAGAQLHRAHRLVQALGGVRQEGHLRRRDPQHAGRPGPRPLLDREHLLAAGHAAALEGPEPLAGRGVRPGPGRLPAGAEMCHTVQPHELPLVDERHGGLPQ